MPQEDLGALLRRLRSSAGLTQEELAERAGISARTISDVERGLRDVIYRDTAARLARALTLSEEQRHGLETLARGRRPMQPVREEPPDAAAPLPARLTPLIGRSRELAAIVAMLTDPVVRLVTVTGTGGIGKTRLATEAGAVVASHYPDGVWFIPLADTRDPAVLTVLLVRALRLSPSDEPVGRRLKAHLGGKRALLILDTFEHLLDAAPLVADLLAACPNLTVLATSRAPLHLRGEHEFPVPTLGLPQQHTPTTVEDLNGFPATALFVQRVHAIRPDLRLDGSTAMDVAEICRRLDGIPLAIELAAARVKHLPVGTLRLRLLDRMAILSGGPRDSPPRQQAMRETVAWSHDLLEPDDQLLFRALSVFAGWSLDAAEAVCSLPDRHVDVLSGLSSLVDHSLVTLAGEPGQERYVMLDVVRDYAAELRHGQPDVDRWAARHADYFISMAEEAEPRLRTTGQTAWHRLLEADLANLRIAFRWSIQNRDAGRALRLAGALWMFWRWQGGFAEGQAWLNEALSIAADAHPEERARALWGAGWLAYDQGDAAATNRIATQLLQLAAATAHPVHRRNGLTLQGMAAMADRRYQAAVGFFEGALDAAEQAGNGWLLATSVLNLGVAALHAGDAQRGERLIDDAVRRYQAHGDELFEARATRYLAVCALVRGDARRAVRLFHDCLDRACELGEKWGIAESLEGMALISAATGRLERAARFTGAAEALREELGARQHPFDRDLFERHLAQTSIESAAWQSSREAGRAMSLAEVIALATP